MKFHSLLPSFLLGLAACIFAADPVVTNVRGQQRTDGSELVDVFFDLADPDSASATVGLQVSADEGATWSVPVTTVSQSVGTGVTPGKDKHILWNAGADWNNQFSNKVRFKVTASDTPPITGEFALIPAGSFQMGQTAIAEPVHSVYVSGFYMARYETTKELWDEVRAWGIANGRGYDLAVGNGGYASKGVNHPVHSITWYDMVKWCNARSEKENLTPCYTVGGLTYKTGQNDAVVCNFAANGYRLPTEAEWEKAGRGGLSGKLFSWGDASISHDRANFWNNGGQTYQTGTTGPHPLWSNNDNGVYPYSSPVGSFAPEPNYGLYDMAGNMWECCWDRYGAYTADSQTNPQGAPGGSDRVGRGGSWSGYAWYSRCANRRNFWPGYAGISNGFRLAQGQP